jgi:succinate dehydrogenase / fumarate reductase, cytochrome b subunit
MSKSVLIKSSIAKKYWMAFTGLFLCLFLVGHLIGNLQLFKLGEEGRRAFNEYAYFMQSNPFIKIMSYLTYLSILFHAIDGLLLAVQNKKARPVQYAMNNANANSKAPARQMALLGSIILIFIATHMVNFWGKMHFGGLDLHTNKVEETRSIGPIPTTGEYIDRSFDISYYLTTKGEYIEDVCFAKEVNLYVNLKTFATSAKKEELSDIKIVDGTKLYDKKSNLQIGEGYKDLHTAVMTFFGKSTNGKEANDMALIAVILYTISMLVLSFHLMHGFASAFQSLGLRHPFYTPIIEKIGMAFSIVVPLLFAAIPIYIYIS